MQKNPDREWFLFRNEKEEGPYSEELLLQKIKNKEITHETYTFTEGFIDWTLIENSEIIGEHFQSKASLEKELENQQPRHEEKSSWLLKIFTFFSILFALFSIGYFFWDAPSKSFSLKGTPFKQSHSVENKLSALTWSELKEFRTKAQETPFESFALLKNNFEKTKLINLKGALASQINEDYVVALLAPVAGESYAENFDHQILLASAQDGFFNLGPLEKESERDFSGKYQLLLRGKENFIGSTVIELSRADNPEKKQTAFIKAQNNYIEKQSIQNEAPLQAIALADQYKKHLEQLKAPQDLQMNEWVPSFLKVYAEMKRNSLLREFFKKENFSFLTFNQNLLDSVESLQKNQEDSLPKITLLLSNYEKIYSQLNQDYAMKKEAFPSFQSLKKVLMEYQL